jgi:hypothetical protein
MASTIGIPCPACNELLFAPIISFNECHHNVHKKCFDDIVSHHTPCPVCNVTITQGTENQELAQLIARINQASQSKLMRHQPSLAKLLHAAIEEERSRQFAAYT